VDNDKHAMSRPNNSAKCRHVPFQATPHSVGDKHISGASTTRRHCELVEGIGKCFGRKGFTLNTAETQDATQKFGIAGLELLVVFWITTELLGSRIWSQSV
jgi:hypothetical protein